MCYNTIYSNRHLNLRDVNYPSKVQFFHSSQRKLFMMETRGFQDYTCTDDHPQVCVDRNSIKNYKMHIILYLDTIIFMFIFNNVFVHFGNLSGMFLLPLHHCLICGQMFTTFQSLLLGNKSSHTCLHFFGLFSTLL